VRVVATAEVPPVARLAFAPLGDIVVRATLTPEPRAEVLIVRGTTLDEATLALLPGLRVIARTGAGVDNLDVAAATRRGIPIVYAPGIGSQPVAEGTVALMLAAAKRLRELGAVVEQAAWGSRYELAGLDIEGACLGVVGYGSIGRRVAALCRGLGMETIAYDPAIEPFSEADVELVALEELLERADVITLHCGLTDETRGLVNRRLLARVKPGAILVNVARGALVESENVLAEALARGQLSAVALDVFPSEPPPSGHHLFGDPRVICTPHAVGLTARWNEHVFHSLARDVRSVLAGELPANLLNPDALSANRS
jgi:D-3-phosphoglycerate dehydrogenase